MSQIVATENQSYQKSNLLINSKYKTTVFENKLLALSLTRIAQNDYTISDKDELVVKIKAAQIRRMLNRNSGNFYNQLKQTADRLTKTNLGVEDPQNGTFKFISLTQSAGYEDETFFVKFNYELTEYLTDIRRNYTTLNLSTMLNFKYDYSFRLYEILRSKIYKGMTYQEPIEIVFNLSELKFNLGVIDIDDPTIRAKVSNLKHPDYDKLLESLPKSKIKYEKYSNFKARVLDPCVTDINGNEKANMRVEYKSHSCGTNHKVYQISFFIFQNKNNVDVVSAPQKTSDVSEDEKFEFIMKVHEALDISLKDATAIGESADYDIERFYKAKEAMDAYGGEISNVTGFLIKAIKENFSVKKKEKEKPKTQANFKSRTYTDAEFDEIERKLLMQSLMQS